MVDKHVVKMILETAQLLCTAHRVLDGKEQVENTGKRKIKRYHLDNSLNNILYKATHINHPSALWARESNKNYEWLYKHFVALLEEYTFRFNKIHKCNFLIDILNKVPNNIKVNSQTQIKQAMDDKFKISIDPIINYRNYYKTGKSHLFRWTNREIPSWIS